MKNCDKNPKILENFVKRKTKAENCWESDEEEDGEDEFEEIGDSGYLQGVDLLGTGTPPSTPPPSKLPNFSTPISPVAPMMPSTTDSPLSAVPSWLTSSAPTPQSYTSSPVLAAGPRSQPPNQAYASASTPINHSVPAIPNLNTSASTGNLPSQQPSTPKPSNAKFQTSRNRPPPTVKSTKRSKDFGGGAVRDRANKRIVKQQMAELRDLGAKSQKRIMKMDKDHQTEKDKLFDQYKKLTDQNNKSIDTQKKTLEKQHKQELDGLVKAHSREQKTQQKENETQERNLQRDIREFARNNTKNHELNKKKMQKEQKLTYKQSKKMRPKTERALMKKEHKVELLLNDKCQTLMLAREQVFKEKEIEWEHHLSFDKIVLQQSDQAQKQEVDILKQQLQFELDSLASRFNLRNEEQQKLQPLELKQMREKHDLQQKNLKEQLQVEKDQQAKLLITEQKALRKAHLEKKRRLEKENLGEIKQLSKSQIPKNEIKLKAAESKSKLTKIQQDMDDEFDAQLAEQKKEEDEAIQMGQNRIFQQLLDRQADEVKDLGTAQAKAQNELVDEEMQQRIVLLKEHHAREKGLLEKHHNDQNALQEKLHADQLALLRTQHQQCIELVENQRQELLNFLQSNTDKLLPGSNQIFSDRIETQIKEVLELRQSVQQKVQAEVSQQLEKEQRDLKQIQFQQKQDLETRHKAEKEDLAKKAQACSSLKDIN